MQITHQRPMDMFRNYQINAVPNAQNIDIASALTFNNTQSGAYDSFSIKLNTYNSGDGSVFSAGDVSMKILEYAEKNNIDTNMTTHRISEDGKGVIFTTGSFTDFNGIKMINYDNGNSFLVTWEELGLPASLSMNSDDGWFLNHHIFGEVHFGGGYLNVNSNEMLEAGEQYKLLTEHWYSVNSPPPDTGSLLKDSKISEFNSASLFTGHGVNIKNSITSTDTVINNFISEYNKIAALKQAKIDELRLYYSIEAIIKRAENAGFGNDVDMLQKITDAQYKHGQDLIESIEKHWGYVDLEKGLEKSLGNYLADKWDFNQVIDLFGFEYTRENRVALAESFANAVLNGGNIKIGDYTLSYEQFLSIESTMTNVYSGFSAMLNGGSNRLSDLQNMIAQESRKHSDSRIGSLLNNWFSNMTSVYNHIIALKQANINNAIWNIKSWEGYDNPYVQAAAQALPADHPFALKGNV